jgi:hypothetical protein
MPRIARAVAVGFPHHITQRGNYRQRVFEDCYLEDCYLVKEHGDCSAYLREKDDAQLIKEVRQGIKTGRPCGDEGFLQKLEGMLGRKLAALPRGRPRKSK